MSNKLRKKIIRKVKPLPTLKKHQVIYALVQERLAGSISVEALEQRKSICEKCPLVKNCKAAQAITRAETACPAYLWPRFNAKTYAEMPPQNQLTRHLIYHIWPVVGSVWRHNIEELNKRWHLFNGLKRFGIVTDKTTESFEEARQYITDVTQDNSIEYITQKNSTGLREVATFIDLLKPISEYTGIGDITFSAHAKGIKYSDDLQKRWQDSALWKWILCMYRTCLDDQESLHRHLSAFPFAGSFKRYGQFAYSKNFRWHYSGTFYWFRNKDLFNIAINPKVKNSGWQRILRQWFGTEAYPANHFDIHETSCLFADDAGNLYLDNEWERLKPEIELYEAARR